MASRTGPRALVSALLCGLLALPVQAAEPMAFPADVQVALLLKILTYDRSFKFKFKSGVSIGVVYSASDAGSRSARDEVLKTLGQLRGRSIKGVTIKALGIEYTNPDELEKIVRANRVNVFYVAPGTAKSIDAILGVGRTFAITTATGVPEYVDKGVTIGIGKKQGKPDIMINLASSRKEGSEFDASLLRIANVK